MARRKTTAQLPAKDDDYTAFLSGLSGLLDQARRTSARVVNGILTATYWEMGRRIVEFEQGGEARAAYGEGLLQKLAHDLAAQHGRGFSERNLRLMRAFYLGWAIRQTPSAKLEAQAATGEGPASTQNVLPAQLEVLALAGAFPLPWSHYVRLLSVENLQARRFYEAEALRGGWSIRLDRQVGSQFYDRMLELRQEQ